MYDLRFKLTKNAATPKRSSNALRDVQYFVEIMTTETKGGTRILSTCLGNQNIKDDTPTLYINDHSLVFTVNLHVCFYNNASDLTTVFTSISGLHTTTKQLLVVKPVWPIWCTDHVGSNGRWW